MHPYAENEFEKDPAEVLPYGLDWQPWLDREAIESVPSFAWEIPEGLDSPLDPFSQVVDGHLVSGVWLAGGTPGRSYRLFCKATHGPKVARRSIVVHVRER